MTHSPKSFNVVRRRRRRLLSHLGSGPRGRRHVRQWRRARVQRLRVGRRLLLLLRRLLLLLLLRSVFERLDVGRSHRARGRRVRAEHSAAI